jgi:hypothetical protein
MENNKQTFTPEESLELITRTIAGYKSSYRQNNFYFLLWGWLIALASISHFVILRILLKNEAYGDIKLYSMLNWGIIILAGMILQFSHINKVKRETRVSSHLEKYMSVLWQVSAAAMILAGIFSMKLQIYPSPFILTIAALATTVTGIQIKFRPMIFGGIAMFIAAAVSVFVLNEYQLLISAAALVVGYLVPGYMLKSTNS